jgi:two-component system sensor histidine kinase DegS
MNPPSIPPSPVPSRARARAVFFLRYLPVLRQHLGPRGNADGAQARALGRAAVACGLGPRDLVAVHERAMITLAPKLDLADVRGGPIKRAGLFLTSAMIPLESAQRTTRTAIRNLGQRNATLRLHTAALARGNRRLAREVARREAGEATIIRGQEKFRALFLESQIMQKKLRHLTRQILSAQEDERKKISRELHDEVVQTLVGINVELTALGASVAADLTAFRCRLTRTRRLVEASVDAVHRFARELRPAVLDDLGLIPALHAYCRSLAERKGLKIHLTAFAGVEALDGTRRTALFRMAQEALTNVVRHAGATRVDLSIMQLPGVVRMEVADNGCSFSVEKILRNRNPKRIGLVGMKERIEMVGGVFSVDSTPGKGTTVRAEMPFSIKSPIPPL